jgi:class 3 adenylate cyclase
MVESHLGSDGYSAHASTTDRDGPDARRGGVDAHRGALGDARYREISSRFNRIVRAGLKRFGGKEEHNAGDGFFATFSQPDRAIRCAVTIAEEVRTRALAFDDETDSLWVDVE